MKHVSYEAVNENSRVFTASADTGVQALRKCVNRIRREMGMHVIIHGANVTIDEDGVWRAIVVAA